MEEGITEGEGEARTEGGGRWRVLVSTYKVTSYAKEGPWVVHLIL